MLALHLGILVVSLVINDVTSQLGGASCPYHTPCTCSGKIIDCHYKNLDTVPLLHNFTGSYKQLHLYGNNISYIGHGTLPPGLYHVNLNGNPIQNISKSAFSESSKTMRSITFAGAKFHSLPRALEVFDNLTSLHIYNSPIKNYPDTVMAELARSVTDLSLNSVGLTAWPKWMEWFWFLRKLDLRNNLIGSLPDNALKTWVTELTDLSLQNTGANNTKTLQSLKALKRLDMHNNQISDHVLLTYDLLPSSGTLEYMYLGHNLLTQLPRLEVFPHLTSVVFMYNKIDKDSQGAFPTSLVYLNLDNNLFTKIPVSIKSLSKLQSLELCANAITRVGRNEFPINSDLRSLYLDANPIRSIDKHAFDNVRRLTYLYLAGTSLTRLPLALTILDNLIHLDMQSIQHLECKCDEKSVATWISNSTLRTVVGQCNHVEIKDVVPHMVRHCP